MSNGKERPEAGMLVLIILLKERAMPGDLDTFLVGWYTVTNDRRREQFGPQKPRRRGKRPEPSDSEVLTLALVAQWLVRHAVAHWRGSFPRLLSQSACHRRVRDLTGVLVHLVSRVAADLGAALAPYQALDTVLVPLARRRRGRAPPAVRGRGWHRPGWE